MKKYSLYIITIPLAIASLALIVWLGGKNLTTKTNSSVSGEATQVRFEKEANRSISTITDVKTEDINPISKESVDFFYSNEIVNPFTSEKYFVRRDKGEEKCLIKYPLTSIPNECKLSPYENDKIGICGQDRFNNDPTVCDLMVRRSNGSIDFVADLLRVVDPNKPETVVDKIALGAELIKFVSSDKILMFYGYDFPDSHQGIIRVFNLKAAELESPTISYYGEGNHSFFSIYKNNKSLLFSNEDYVLNFPAKEKGIYLMNEEDKEIKRIYFPGQYDFDKKPLVHIKVRENYQNENVAVITIEDESYTFDFDREAFIK